MDPVYLDFRFNLPITVFFEVEVPKGPTPAQGLFKCRCIADRLKSAPAVLAPEAASPQKNGPACEKARRSVSSGGPRSTK